LPLWSCTSENPVPIASRTRNNSRHLVAWQSSCDLADARLPRAGEPVAKSCPSTLESAQAAVVTRYPLADISRCRFHNTCSAPPALFSFTGNNGYAENKIRSPIPITPFFMRFWPSVPGLRPTRGQRPHTDRCPRSPIPNTRNSTCLRAEAASNHVAAASKTSPPSYQSCARTHPVSHTPPASALFVALQLS